jgi:hypothetical protein
MSKSDNSLVKITHEHGPSGFLFFVAYIGAVIYFAQQSPGFWGFITALLQAIVWPAYVLYGVLRSLGA